MDKDNFEEQLRVCEHGPNLEEKTSCLSNHRKSFIAILQEKSASSTFFQIDLIQILSLANCICCQDYTRLDIDHSQHPLG